RLAFLPNPAIDNIYLSPGTIYTYPFPGTHFLMALITRVAAVDPLFAYHKLRFFWTIAALVFVYLGARAIFRKQVVGYVAALTAVVFLLNGTYADVPGSYWAQLAPYSHVSDLAMNVLLPALIVLALYFLSEQSA